MASLPKDDNHIAYQLSPAVIALAQTVSSSLSASTTITFNAATSILRVYATSQDIFLKWGTSAVTSSNFDEVIPAGQIVDLLIPRVAATGVRYTACTLIERSASASVCVIEK